MTSRTGAALDRAAALGRPALIGYLPVGFPTVDGSITAVRTMVEHGVDVVELGIPYSDPVMDGPVIQHAVDRALAGGVRVRDCLSAIEKLADLGVPVLPMSYWNVVARYGVTAWARDLAQAGGAGMITPDLIPDEADEWLEASAEHDLDRVFLAAPTSRPERLERVARASRGFVYAASTMGVTGERSTVGARAEQLVAATRAAGADHVCVGLGVSTGAHAAQVGAYADGVIVGSALVRALTEAEDEVDGLTRLAATAKDLAAGVSRARMP
jgi:tryptophan synthase alpha chain